MKNRILLLLSVLLLVIFGQFSLFGSKNTSEKKLKKIHKINKININFDKDLIQKRFKIQTIAQVLDVLGDSYALKYGLESYSIDDISMFYPNSIIDMRDVTLDDIIKEALQKIKGAKYCSKKYEDRFFNIYPCDILNHKKYLLNKKIKNFIISNKSVIETFIEINRIMEKEGGGQLNLAAFIRYGPRNINLNMKNVTIREILNQLILKGYIKCWKTNIDKEHIDGDVYIIAY